MRGITIWKEGPRFLKTICLVSHRAGAIHRTRIFVHSIPAILSMLLLMASACPAADVTLAWDPNPEQAIQGYRVYYGTDSYFYTSVIDVGNQTALTITGLLPGVTYFFSATAYNAEGDESYFSGEIAYTVPGASVSSSGSGGGGGGCFIATAAYGSSLSPEVETLREFRDRVLLTCSLGQSFVEWYYRVSPPVAAFIAGHESLKMTVRLGLMPIVCAVKHPSSILLVVSAPLFVFVLIMRIRRKR